MARPPTLEFLALPDGTASPRIEPIRMRTLILLRWVALAGQAASVVVALAIGVGFALVPVLLLVALAFAVNLWLTLWPGRARAAGPTWQLVFDLVQLAALIALTGGMSNPFALLILAPVTVAATALPDRETVLIGAATILLISLAGWFALPLELRGEPLALAPLMQLAHWLALLIGVVFFAAYALRVTRELGATADALFATQMALAREQRLHHLGGVVAAAAHEMGTPLATIKLIASELGHDLARALPDRTDLAEDARTLQVSVDRCRDILRAMGEAGQEDLLTRVAPLGHLVSEAAEPHAGRGRDLVMRIGAEGETHPVVRRDPGVIHGLRNLIQNAVDFASSKVVVEGSWTDREIRLVISDDGPGFSPAMLARAGEPFPAGRQGQGRGLYEGMGLGLFIARTLLEASGAEMRIGNGAEGGARIELIWPAHALIASDRLRLGPNPINSRLR